MTIKQRVNQRCLVEMNRLNMGRFLRQSVALKLGVLSVLVGLLAFMLSWHIWDGQMPGYQWFLYPGNLTLKIIWHPLLTEEINFWSKLTLLLLGQFVVVAAVTCLVKALFKGLIR
jgi:hypothetical protein